MINLKPDQLSMLINGFISILQIIANLISNFKEVK